MQTIENGRTTERPRSGRTRSATSLFQKDFTMYLLCTNYVPPPLNRRSTKTQNNMDTLLKGSHRSIESFYFTKRTLLDHQLGGLSCGYQTQGIHTIRDIGHVDVQTWQYREFIPTLHHFAL